MDKSTHEIRLAHWKQIIGQCQSRPKEQTAKQWLEEHDISDKAYYYWLRKIRRTIYDQSVASGTLPVVSQEQELAFAQMPDNYLKDYPSSFSFEPVAVIKTPTATLAISNEVSDHLLNQLVKAVSHA